MFAPRSTLRVFAVAALAVALTAAFATAAFAAPTVPIMTFADLRTALSNDPSHHLDGYMKTVVEDTTTTVTGGSDITTIPLKVLAVPQTGTAYDDSSLITFEASGALIAKYGGIVAGMSGSPVYVYTAGGDKLIGAVSYGDYFTLGGRGLATPIEAMSQIETAHAAEVVPTSKPVITSAGVINKIIVAPDPQNYAGAAAEGAFVAKPLASVFIGGLSPSSSVYKMLVKDFDARGIKIVSLNTPLAADSGGAPFSTEMTAGASIAALAACGDMWVGGVGTVTYVNGNNVLAFGHPAYWSGVTSLYMTNAWIESVWPNSFEPYKMADAGAVRGMVVQDRSKGILGKLGTFPNETTITARATNACNCAETTSAVYIPRQLLANGFADSTLVGSAAYVAGSKLFDQRNTPGSACTTTTVFVGNGLRVYEISIVNHVSSDFDITTAAADDAQKIISNLQSVLAWGTEDLQVLSVDLVATYCTQNRGAQIVGVDTPHGLHAGDNRVDVQALVYGQAATQTIITTLTIPAGVSLDGKLSATAVGDGAEDSPAVDSPAQPKRRTIAQIAAELNGALPATALSLTFTPGSYSSNYMDLDLSASGSPISASVVTSWPISGRASTSIPRIYLTPGTRSVDHGGRSSVVGWVSGLTDSTVVSMYATVAGDTTETLVATQSVSPSNYVIPDGYFMFPVDEAFTNTSYRIHIDGTASSASAETNFILYVKAEIALSASASRVRQGKSVRLTSMVFPSTSAGGNVTFEQYASKRWRKIATRTLTASGSLSRASYSWKPGRGTRKVRARYLGGTYNASSASAAKVVVVVR